MSRYGYRHQQIRAALLPQAYGRACLHCGLPMLPGQALDLDHTADGTQYRGLVHSRCNRREGARWGNARRLRRGGVFWPSLTDALAELEELLEPLEGEPHLVWPRELRRALCGVVVHGPAMPWAEVPGPVCPECEAIWARHR